MVPVLILSPVIVLTLVLLFRLLPLNPWAYILLGYVALTLGFMWYVPEAVETLGDGLILLVAGPCVLCVVVRDIIQPMRGGSKPSKPADWPDWLKEANTEGCEVEIRDGCVVWKRGRWISGTWKGGLWEDGVWFDGVWEDGAWRKGTWHNGVWEAGVWQDGIWYNGIWESGLWESGTWRGGIWRGGTWGRGHWHKGTWQDGVWFHGVWESGIWQSGVWRDGVWHGGVWKQGSWEGGHNTVPRFGWSLLSSGLISGYRGPTPTIMWASGWEPHLKDMEPEKADEYRALLLWKQMREAPRSKAAPGPSLWDHIEEEL